MLRKIREIFGGKSAPHPDSPETRTSLPITVESPACPYCGVIQDPPPKRHRKCKDCQERIYVVWADREARRKRLVVDDEYERVKASEREEELRRREESQRLKASRWDERFRNLNLEIISAAEAGNLWKVHLLQFQQAGMLRERKIDHRPALSEALATRLHSFRQLGTRKVTIYTQRDANCCSHCKVLDGKIFTIDQALKQSPLPVLTCQNEAQETPFGGWCRCHYDQVPNSE